MVDDSAFSSEIEQKFINAYLDGTQSGLEIAATRSDWTDLLKNRTEELFRASHFEDLDDIPPEAIDFIFSFEAFLQMASPEMESFLKEMTRILRPGGRAVIRHAHRNTILLGFKMLILDPLGEAGEKIQERLLPGWNRPQRADQCALGVKFMAGRAGLRVTQQKTTPSDCLTVFQKIP